MDHSVILFGRVSLLAAIIIATTVGCEAKRAIKPRSTTKGEIELPAGTATTTGTGSTNIATSPSPAIEREADAPTAGVSASRKLSPVTAAQVPVKAARIELFSPRVVQTAAYTYQGSVKYRFISGEPNPEKRYVVQTDFLGVVESEFEYEWGSSLYSEGELSWSMVPSTAVRSRPLTTFTMIMGESNGPDGQTGFSGRSNIVSGRIEWPN
jgi:hypothetical protein